MIKMPNQYRYPQKIIILSRQFQKAWKLGDVSLHTSNQYIHMVDVMASNFKLVDINCSIK